MAFPTSIGSISTYRNKKRACCQSRTASSILYTISTPKWRVDVDISGILRIQLYSLHQRFTGHMDITLHGCLYGGMSPKQLKNLGRHTPFDDSGCTGMTEVMEPHVPKSPVNQSPKYYCFPMGQPGQPPLYLSYYSDNSNNIIPIPLILFRNATM